MTANRRAANDRPTGVSSPRAETPVSLSRLRKPLLAIGLAATLPALWFGGRWVLAEHHLGKARQALIARDAESALGQLEDAAQYRPESAEIEFLRARAYRRLGRLVEVRTHLERAWKLGHPVGELEREQWLVLAQNGQLAEAEPHLAKLLTNSDGDGAEICEAYVAGYLLSYRFDQALGLLEAWQADFPDDAQPYFLRGAYYEHNDQVPQAIAEFEKAIALDPERDDVRVRLAALLSGQRRQEEAAKHFEVLLSSQPDDPAVLAAWGTHLVAEGRTDEARSVLERVVARYPEHFEAGLELGRLELQAGDAAGAVRRLEPLLAQKPHEIELRYALASALGAAGDADAAKPHFDYVAEARPAVTRARDLMDQVSQRPHDVELRYEIGMTLLKYDSPSDGAAWLRSVLDLRPDHRPARLALAEYYAATGKGDDAARLRSLGAAGK